MTLFIDLVYCLSSESRGFSTKFVADFLNGIHLLTRIHFSIILLLNTFISSIFNLNMPVIHKAFNTTQPDEASFWKKRELLFTSPCPHSGQGLRSLDFSQSPVKIISVILTSFSFLARIICITSRIFFESAVV